jgi:hypothetical protein
MVVVRRASVIGGIVNHTFAPILRFAAEIGVYNGIYYSSQMLVRYNLR